MDRSIGLFFLIFSWLLFGGVAALWWLPAALGEEKPLTWQFGAICLIAQWVWVFNHWPRLGTRRFFQESYNLKLQLLLLGVISVLFALGFVFVLVQDFVHRFLPVTNNCKKQCRLYMHKSIQPPSEGRKFYHWH